MKIVLPFWDGPAPTRIDLTDRMAAWGIPGISIAAFEGGEIVRAEGFGVRRSGTSDPVTPNTVFQAGSIGKAVTAVGVLRLVQQKKLDLDLDVNGYLRSWKVPASGRWQPQITLRQLLSHSAGTTVHGFIGYREDEPIPTLRQILDGTPPAKNRPVRVDVLPGTHFRYSGGGTTIVQAVMMDITGQDFPTLMRKGLFEPLGMASSTFECPLPASLERRAASGHWFGSDVAAGGRYVHPEAAAAGLWSTPTDLARLAIAVQRAWSGAATDFLRPDLVLEMLLPQIAPPGTLWVGLGSFLDGTGTSARFGHSGDTFGFNAELTCFTETGQGAAVMTNSITGATIIAEVLRTLADEHGWPALGTPRCAETDEAGSSAESLAGSYELGSGARIDITIEEGMTLLRMQRQPPLRLRACSHDTLIADELDLRVRMGRDRSVLRLEQGSVTVDAHSA